MPIYLMPSNCCISGALVGLIIKALSHFALGDWRVCISSCIMLLFGRYLEAIGGPVSVF